MSLVIRSATPADGPLILRFIRELAEFEQLAHEVEATEAQLQTHLFGASPAAGCVIAERDGEPAGFALFFTNFSTFLARPGLHLEDLYVAPAHRGRGIGRGLLLHVARLAHERGCGRLEWVVLDWNTRAIALYESLGARRLTDWTTCRLDRAALARLTAEATPAA